MISCLGTQNDLAMAKMIILQGTPCAGKSTWARAEVTGKENWLIVSRDSIRHGLGDYWVLKREKYVSSIEDEMIRLALQMKFNVINDGTNLDEARVRHLQAIADETDTIVELKEMYIPFREAVRRDGNADRLHHLGSDEIRAFYEKYYPERLAEELSQPEPAVPAAPNETAVRIVTDTDGTPISWEPTAKDIENVKQAALHRFTFSQIALMLEVPGNLFRAQMADPESAVYKAYYSGKLESETDYRAKVMRLAATGEEWAVKQVEAWNRQQMEEEFGAIK